MNVNTIHDQASLFRLTGGIEIHSKPVCAQAQRDLITEWLCDVRSFRHNIPPWPIKQDTIGCFLAYSIFAKIMYIYTLCSFLVWTLRNIKKWKHENIALKSSILFSTANQPKTSWNFILSSIKMAHHGTYI